MVKTRSQRALDKTGEVSPPSVENDEKTLVRNSHDPGHTAPLQRLTRKTRTQYLPKMIPLQLKGPPERENHGNGWNGLARRMHLICVASTKSLRLIQLKLHTDRKYIRHLWIPSSQRIADQKHTNWTISSLKRTVRESEIRWGNKRPRNQRRMYRRRNR